MTKKRRFCLCLLARYDTLHLKSYVYVNNCVKCKFLGYESKFNQNGTVVGLSQEE